MWSKRFKSVTALLLAGSIIATVPVISSGAAISASAASTVSASASASEWYYDTIDSITEGEYVFYNATTKTLMTDVLNSGNNSFPSYKADNLVFPAKASAVPAEYRYTIKPLGNGCCYIMNSDGLYLDIVTYGKLQFTSTPSPLTFEIQDGGAVQVAIKKTVGDKEYAISMYSDAWFTVHDYSKNDSGQIFTLVKYKEKNSASIKKLSDFNIANYDTDREFTPKRVGDIAAYSKDKLKMRFGFSNRIATGIWATPGEKLKIYVQAEDLDPIPHILFTQHISDSTEIKEVALARGMNEITVPALHTDFSTYETATEPGGCIYLINPYTTAQQSSNVKVYIEGGDKIPIFRQGDNVQKFVAELSDYYENYQQGKKGYHNVAELTSKHTIFTLALTRVYEGYVTNAIDPQKVSLAWDKYYEELFEFGGLEPSEYKNLVLPIKLNQPYGGAYASILGFMGIQDGDMSAAALTENRRGWGYSHETGHILDIEGRTYIEITNNMWAMAYGLKNETLYDIAIPKRTDETIPLAQNETNSIWNTNPINFWGLSMFWDLEVYHNGYWAELDDMFRDGTCGNKTVDSYARNLSAEEKIAVYSSKILGIDLTYYFKRYGYITNPSANYTAAINAMSLSKSQPKFWYYDDYAYTMPLNTNVGKSGTLEASCDKQTKSMFFTISDSYKDAHLGFEIVKDGKVLDFVWDYRYVTDVSGDYTINAYDRSLNVYKSITINYSYNPLQYMAYSGNTYYSSIQQAVNAAPNGGIVYIDKSTSIDEQIVVDGKSVTIMPYDKTKKIVIYNNISSDPFIIKNGGSLTIKTYSDKDDMFVIDGQLQTYYRAFTLSGNSSLTLGKGVTVRRFRKDNAGAAVHSTGSTVNLQGCIIEFNYSTYATVCVTGGSTLHSSNGTVFRQNRTDYSSSAFYTYSSNDRAYIKDTTMYKNFSNHQATGSTIYVRGGYVSIGNGTSINSNITDWYNIHGAMYIRAGSKVEFSGNLNINDLVTTEEKLSINPQVSGILNVRTELDYADSGSPLAVPTSGSFPKSITNVVKYSNNSYYIVNDVNALTIKKWLPLVNNSTISATSINLGSSVTVKAASTGGTGSSTYAVYYKKSADTKWTTQQDFKANASISVTPANEGKYNICVKVKDSAGTVEKKYFDITVKKVAFTLDASVKTTTSPFVVLGHTITATGTAKGGAGSYTYAFFYKQKAQTKWTTKQNFSTKNSTVIKPAKATDYDVCVKAKDKAGTVVKKYFTVKVRMPVSFNVTVPTTAKLGKTISVKAEVSGGLEPYTYAFYYRKTTDTKWVTKQDFKTNNSVAIKPANAAEYEICVKVKDSVGTVYKKYFYVKVSK